MSAKSSLITLGLIFGGLLAFAQAPFRYEQILTETEIKKEFCEHDYSFIKDKVCMTSNQQQVKIYMPDFTAKIIANHIQQMEAKKYFLKMDPADFFHGHLIVRGTQSHYASVDEYLKDISGILYHTDEYSGRWLSNKKTPRSLFGLMNGKLILARQMIGSKQVTSTYKDRGTIYSSDIVETHPELTQLSFNLSDSSDVHLSLTIADQNTECVPKPQIHIRPQADGRFQLQNGTRYEILLYCELDTRLVN